VAESVANILARLREEGYDVGDAPEDAAALLEAMTTQALNVSGYAPGELEAMVARGDAVRIAPEQYTAWLDALDPALRDKVIADWGPPDSADVMALADGTIIVPALRYGNVVLMPQPARGWGEDLTQLYHASDLAPPHQYVAAYRWIREAFDAHAVVHLGTHGTLEWLDGKDIGLSSEDPSDALIADLPHVYAYNVDVVGEGLVARRRSAATLIDHMVPPFRQGGLYAELAELSERINDYDRNLHQNLQLVAAISGEIRELVTELGIAKDLGLDLAGEGALDDETVHEIQDHLYSLRDQNIPWGLHAFGRTPTPEQRASTVDAIVSVDRSLLPDARAVLAEEMEQRIVDSGPQELARLVQALDGRYIPGGNGGEPIRNPDAYATGKNFYGVDPEKIPKPASWELGVALADQMLADHLAEHGRYPEKVSFVIWGDETMRHEGVLESQIFHLLGTRPVWDARGNVGSPAT
jgi:cobaltochelatase CobN